MPPPTMTFVRSKWKNQFGMKNDIRNTTTTETNAPTAGSSSRRPGLTTPTMTPPR